MQEKLRALEYCIVHGQDEDACRHLCELLWNQGRKIKPSVGSPFTSLRELVDYYGNNPTEIEESPHG